MTCILYIYTYLFIDNHLQFGAWQDLATIFPIQIQYQEPLSHTLWN